MILNGTLSWYIEKKPEYFDPKMALPGEVFYIEQWPENKMTFVRYEQEKLRIHFTEKTKNGHIISRYIEPPIQGFMIKNNHEDLKMHTSIGIETHPDMPIVSIPQALQKYIPLRSVVEVAVNANNKIIKKTLIAGDTGPKNSLVGQIIVEESGCPIFFTGRIGDLPSGIFKEFAPLEQGLIHNATITRL